MRLRVCFSTETGPYLKSKYLIENPKNLPEFARDPIGPDRDPAVNEIMTSKTTTYPPAKAGSQFGSDAQTAGARALAASIVAVVAHRKRTAPEEARPQKTARAPSTCVHCCRPYGAVHKRRELRGGSSFYASSVVSSSSAPSNSIPPFENLAVVFDKPQGAVEVDFRLRPLQQTFVFEPFDVGKVAQRREPKDLQELSSS